jgi:hypothetical protein
LVSLFLISYILFDTKNAKRFKWGDYSEGKNGATAQRYNGKNKMGETETGKLLKTKDKSKKLRSAATKPRFGDKSQSKVK